MKIQRYKHESDVSYALGTTLTFELIKRCPNQVTRVFVSSSADKSEGIKRLIDLCKQNCIQVEKYDKAFNILSPKGNCFVIGEFQKYSGRLEETSHIVLVNPSDAGNLGTMLRTAVGFGITNIAIIKPAVDYFDPKTVRASMGAVFHVTIEQFESINEYIERFPSNSKYAFMLSSDNPITDTPIEEPYSLIFGNEATGLPKEYEEFCKTVIIRHSTEIDSLNLPMAAGIAMYEFTKNKWRNLL